MISPLFLVGVVAGASTPRVKPYYHLSPDYGGLNDPNGLFYFKGVYHIFHQWHDPPSIPIDWFHQTSLDLVHWTRRGYIGVNTTSGGAVMDNNGVPTLILSFGQEVHTAVPTNLSDPFLLEWRLEKRDLMHGNVLPPNVPGYWDVSGFMAPDGTYRLISGSCERAGGNGSYCDGGSTPGNPQVMVSAAAKFGDDFRFANIPWKASNATYGPRVECPQMFQRGLVPPNDRATVGLLMSMPEWYQNILFLGEYQYPNISGDFRLKARYPHGKVLDYGDVYAGQTLLDDSPSEGGPRRIFWGWVVGDKNCGVLCANRTSAGSLTLPRVISLLRATTEEGGAEFRPSTAKPPRESAWQLHQESADYIIATDVAPEIEKLRMLPAAVDQQGLVLKSSPLLHWASLPPHVAGDSVEILLELNGPGGVSPALSVGVRASPDRSEQTVIRYSRIGGLSICTTNVMDPTPDRLPRQPSCSVAPPITQHPEGREAVINRMRIFVDASVIEVHLRASTRETLSLTQRVFPTRDDALGIFLSNEGAEGLKVARYSIWGMNSIYDDEGESSA